MRYFALNLSSRPVMLYDKQKAPRLINKMTPQDYMAKQKKTTANESEISFFNSLAESWWDPKGKFAPLHKFNPVRLDYMTRVIAKEFNRDLSKEKPFKGLTILDVGSGGGLLSEPFSRLGADIIGIDAAERNIKTAQVHAEKMGLNITYHHKTAEEMVKSQKRFDIVLAMEIVEHVDDVPFFISSISQLVAQNGLLFMSTLNRTAKSYLFGIIGAEYVLRWLARGTHNWQKFLKPSELIGEIHSNGLTVEDVIGITYSPLSDRFSLNPKDLSINYMLYAKKMKDSSA